ncbi:MAG: DUF4136 domain-containing protein [Candidatus Latescibacterota bacterium]|nr:MAG: DUF4136 domain-containing protein [Candidatus Latescibacterota bacterium]
MNIRMIVSVAAVIVLMTGCSQKIRVESDWDVEADFTRYKMWDWVPGDAGVTESLTIDNAEVRERIEKVVEEGFWAKGYERTSGAADFYVKYYVGYGEELNTRNIENYYEYMNYSVFVPRVTRTYTDVWEQGTIIIDIIDADAKKLVWRGNAWTEVNPQAGPRENEPKLKEAVKKILEDFPPK